MRLLPKQLITAPCGSGRASRPALTSLECKAACHAARQARSGLGSAFRPAYSALRCEAAAQAARRRVSVVQVGLLLRVRVSPRCRCGFSNTVVQILNACETPFETFDVLGDQRVREGQG